MKRFLLLFFMSACASLSNGADAPAPAGTDKASPVENNAQLQRLVVDFVFTEGPAANKKGDVFFTDQPNNRILQWSVDGKLSTWMQPAGRANGLCFDRKGNLWAAADEKNELWSISPKKAVKVVAKDYQGKLFNGPNDIWINRNGAVYFTDPYYKRDYWTRGEKEMPECVYYLSPDRKELRRVIEDMKQPNGIIGTADGQSIYVADIGGHETYRYKIQKDGSLTHKTLFCKMGSDGMTIDEEGNVYLTGKGVFIFSPSGEQIGHIEVPERWTANVCFGGRDHRTLFITASKGLYSIKMRVKGTDSQ